MSKKIIMFRGLPASGKSTTARELMEKGGNFVRVNRDLLREMLHFGEWSPKNEGMVVAAEVAIVKAALSEDKNVIIDDCNLTDSHADKWKNVAIECGAKFEIKRMKVDWQECVLRDFKREKPVGKDVIFEMAMSLGGVVPKKGYLICDLDGSLCDLSHRLHFLKVPEGQKKDWKSFFEGIPGDIPRQDVLEMLKKYVEEGYEILFVSGRPDTYKEITKEWIKKNFTLPYSGLIMRRAHDKRPDEEVKIGIYEKYLRHYSIHAVLDDRPKVIRGWRSLGLNVIDVGGGVEF